VCDDAEKNASDTRTKIKMITRTPSRTYVRCVSRTHTRTQHIGGTARMGWKAATRVGKGDRRVQGCRTVTAMFCNLN